MITRLPIATNEGRQLLAWSRWLFKRGDQRSRRCGREDDARRQDVFGRNVFERAEVVSESLFYDEFLAQTHPLHQLVEAALEIIGHACRDLGQRLWPSRRSRRPPSFGGGTAVRLPQNAHLKNSR